jgi:DNA primase
VIPKETIAQIMETAIIEEVIGDFLPLKKAGTSYRAHSPFSNEKTPSFFVVPHKGIFKDFSSGKGGNVVNFLMEHEKFSYPEALRWLADKYGIEIQEQELTDDQKEAQTARESISIVTQYAREYFVEQLWESEEGKAIGLSYFRERGFRDDIIKKFQLGYCPDHWDVFTTAALEKGYELKYLLASGLSKEREGSSPYDFFRGRVMFPIQNVSSKTIAFGGRTLRSDKKVAKYFNSPESELYHKSNALYGIDLAKGPMVKEDNCYLVEGYTDVVSMHQSGVENVVASAGTALTEEQVRMIRRYTHNITILFDGDAAGIKASFRGIDLVLKQGLNVKVVCFPDGDDPDSFAKKTPTSELQEFLSTEAKDFIVFKTDLLAKEASGDPMKLAGLIRSIVETIALIPDAIKRSVYLRECSTLLQVDERTLVSEINKLLRREFRKQTGQQPIVEINEVAPVQPRISHSQNCSHQEYDLLRILMNYGEQIIQIDVETDEGQPALADISIARFLIQALDEDQLELEDRRMGKIINEYRDFLHRDEVPGEQHFANHHDQDVSQLAADLLTEKYELSPNWVRHRIYPETEETKLLKAAMDCIQRYKLIRVQRMIAEINERIKSDLGEENELQDLLRRRMTLDKAKASLSAYFGSVIVH